MVGGPVQGRLALDRDPDRWVRLLEWSRQHGDRRRYARVLAIEGEVVGQRDLVECFPKPLRRRRHVRTADQVERPKAHHAHHGTTPAKRPRNAFCLLMLTEEATCYASPSRSPASVAVNRRLARAGR